jgi:L-fucose isomerase-like protein
MATTLGVIIGNRDFFPDALISEARRDLLQVFHELDVTPVWLRESDSKLGAVETWADATKCGEVFRAHRGRIDGNSCLPSQFRR